MKWKGHNLGGKTVALPLKSGMTLNGAHHLSQSQFSELRNGGNVAPQTHWDNGMITF